MILARKHSLSISSNLSANPDERLTMGKENLKFSASDSERNYNVPDTIEESVFEIPVIVINEKRNLFTEKNPRIS